jgi:hypothetical protein
VTAVLAQTRVPPPRDVEHRKTLQFRSQLFCHLKVERVSFKFIHKCGSIPQYPQIHSQIVDLIPQIESRLPISPFLHI